MKNQTTTQAISKLLSGFYPYGVSAEEVADCLNISHTTASRELQASKGVKTCCGTVEQEDGNWYCTPVSTKVKGLPTVAQASKVLAHKIQPGRYDKKELPAEVISALGLSETFEKKAEDWQKRCVNRIAHAKAGLTKKGILTRVGDDLVLAAV